MLNLIKRIFNKEKHIDYVVQKVLDLPEDADCWTHDFVECYHTFIHTGTQIGIGEGFGFDFVIVSDIFKGVKETFGTCIPVSSYEESLLRKKYDRIEKNRSVAARERREYRRHKARRKILKQLGEDEFTIELVG